MRVRILCSLVRFVAAAGFMFLATQGREVLLERDGETLRFGNGTVELLREHDGCLVGDLELHGDDGRNPLLDQALGGAGKWIGSRRARPRRRST